MHKCKNLLNLVRILEPAREVPYITAPSRSRLGSVEMENISAPIRTYGEQLLLPTNYHGMKNLAVNRYLSYFSYFFHILT